MYKRTVEQSPSWRGRESPKLWCSRIRDATRTASTGSLMLGEDTEELNDKDIVAMYSSLDTQEEEDFEETPVKISMREAMEALETLHKYFEMSNIDNSNIIDQIYSIAKQVSATSNQV
ncbi:hypothetical protein WA026_004581 [Henosepilachna vigintioctopunctata]|uniref:Uncharacterized protein n=1 Tax=Henosepilachna vigintioctopunctata TaxID=420089 RepID=A0AAW1V3S3_9CUCU